jgi:hypothetical protein
LLDTAYAAPYGMHSGVAIHEARLAVAAKLIATTTFV